ncbi:salicylic acid-binding protein 2-like [Lolium rigidum]|uniref:salicylic acid-binding protein 2-like n=1 Tax=Lolium rigidum TaxID=89674 RepID=UPI001F5CF8F0|nr:salicylic acid-binding protein 2-like [Lolium rigidum]
MAASMEAACGSGAKHIILVHGACHGGWSWYKVASRLRSGAAELSYHVAAPDLAASGVDARRLSEVPTFRDYTAPLLDVLRSLPEGEKAVLVGHSLGGLSVALAAELFPEKVAAAVFLTAFMPDCVSPPSEVILKNVARSTYTPLDNLMRPQDAEGKLPSSFMFGQQFTEQLLYQLCSPEDLTLGKSLVRIGSLFLEDLQTQPPFTKDHYGLVRKVYVVCKQDKTITEEHQRWMVANNPVDEVMEIDGADHMAMLSTPDQVVKCIIDIANRYN